MLTQINNSRVNLPRCMKPTRLACLTTATLAILLLLCIGLTALSPHVTQVHNRRLAAWKCPLCNTEGNDSNVCGFCECQKPVIPAVWTCPVCNKEGNDGNACGFCESQKPIIQPVRAPLREAPQMPHCCMPMCYDECVDCDGKGCQSCDHSGHAYVCSDCEWVGPGSKCPGKICPGEDGEECGSEVHIKTYQKDLVYLGCDHTFCKYHFDGYVETKVRDDTISCPLFALPASDLLHCNYKVTTAEQREYMTKEKYDRRMEILNNKVIEESGTEMCPQNSETACTWGYLPPRPRPCEDCGGTLSMTMTERVHHTRTWLPYRSSYDEDREIVTPCERCVDTDTPGAEPNQAHSVICMNETCCYKFCSSCKKGWDNERSCPRSGCLSSAPYGKIEVSRGGVRGFFGQTILIDCPECDGNRVVDVRTHEGKTCEEYAVALSTTDKDAADQQKHEQDDEQTLIWKRENTRNCPNCNIVVFKQGDRAAGETDGCNHMTCPCGKDFCWTCGGDAFPPVNGENLGAVDGGYCYTSWCATANGRRGEVIHWV